MERQEGKHMPSLVTHHHFAVLVQQSAEPDLRNACDVSPSAYRWGAQGPDILFFHNAPFGSRTSLLGHRMHAGRIAEAFNALVHSAARQHDPAALSYLLGFCTHYVLDRRTHPYIQDTIETQLMPRYPDYDEDACHRLCEADLDAQIITNYISGEQENFEAFRLLDAPSAQVGRLIGRMLTDVGEPVYHVDTAPPRVEGAMRTMRLVYNILHGGSRDGARAQIELFERMLGQPGLLSTMLRPTTPLPADCANLAHRVWHKPDVPEIDRTDSFFELFESSVQPALSLWRAISNCYHRGTPLNPLFFPANYNGMPEL